MSNTHRTRHPTSALIQYPASSGTVPCMNQFAATRHQENLPSTTYSGTPYMRQYPQCTDYTHLIARGFACSHILGSKRRRLNHTSSLDSPLQLSARTKDDGPFNSTDPSLQPGQIVQPLVSEFGRQQVRDAGSLSSYPTNLQSLDIGISRPKKQEHSQQERDMRRNSSNVHFEDRSIYMNMRNLPIIDELVR